MNGKTAEKHLRKMDREYQASETGKDGKEKWRRLQMK